MHAILHTNFKVQYTDLNEFTEENMNSHYRGKELTRPANAEGRIKNNAENSLAA